ncbi:MAG: LysM domain [Verrucomicrobiota bacterium]|jgi:LysM repeat protein
MKPTVSLSLVAVCLCLLAPSPLIGQTFTPSPAVSAQGDKLEALAKKIEEQNSKIDMLSQEILKLEQQIANMRPGVVIGEASPPTPSPAVSAAASESPRAQNGNSHTVARGETLTSIAKMYNVTAGELQKFNHIENDRKLQIGQTIMIPGSATPAASVSPSPNT